MIIYLNGKKTETDKKTLFEFKPNNPNRIMIVNGFQISSNKPLNNNDEIYIIDKDKLPPKNELEAMMAARHTPGVHNTIKKSKVAIAGLGGLGSNIAVSLARIGVGELFLVDFDTVEPSNLNRQSYYISHLGMYKTDALKKQLAEINPFISVKTQNVYVDESNACELFGDYNIVCEAFDNPSAKAALVNTLLINLPNIKIVAASGMAGYGSSNEIKTARKIKNLYVCGDFMTSAEEGIGLMAPRVLVCAGHQANMVLRLLLGTDEV